MPKIAEATLADHRAHITSRVLDAAEEILRERPPVHLTAAAVAARAGIARNSLYRYVESVEALPLLVAERYLPAWNRAVHEAVTAARTPEARIRVWVVENLRQAALTGHGWLMEAVRNAPRTSQRENSVRQMHTAGRGILADAWESLLGTDPTRKEIALGLTLALTDAGFRQLDAGLPAETVQDMAAHAAQGLTTALCTVSAS
ncbi:MAG: TetR family transcriptional regulator [Microbacteriaceae bacterium]|nr:TetR family transcriptional regulator [Microbacteriaceae bacterium]MCI1207236.1 TetR family transcriptional regulator [Microbacteriaceae bacterium]